MKIRNNEELLMLERTIGICCGPVLLVTSDGQQYNLKNPMERYLGLGKLICGHDMDDLEIFVSRYEDEMRLFNFIIDCMNHQCTKTA